MLWTVCIKPVSDMLLLLRFSIVKCGEVTPKFTTWTKIDYDSYFWPNYKSGDSKDTAGSVNHGGVYSPCARKVCSELEQKVYAHPVPSDAIGAYKGQFSNEYDFRNPEHVLLRNPKLGMDVDFSKVSNDDKMVHYRDLDKASHFKWSFYVRGKDMAEHSSTSGTPIQGFSTVITSQLVSLSSDKFKTSVHPDDIEDKASQEVYICKFPDIQFKYFDPTDVYIVKDTSSTKFQKGCVFYEGGNSLYDDTESLKKKILQSSPGNDFILKTGETPLHPNENDVTAGRKEAMEHSVVIKETLAWSFQFQNYYSDSDRTSGLSETPAQCPLAFCEDTLPLKELYKKCLPDVDGALDKYQINSDDTKEATGEYLFRAYIGPDKNNKGISIVDVKKMYIAEQESFKDVGGHEISCKEISGRLEGSCTRSCVKNEAVGGKKYRFKFDRCSTPKCKDEKEKKFWYLDLDMLKKMQGKVYEGKAKNEGDYTASGLGEENPYLLYKKSSLVSLLLHGEETLKNEQEAIVRLESLTFKSFDDLAKRPEKTYLAKRFYEIPKQSGEEGEDIYLDWFALPFVGTLEKKTSGVLYLGDLVLSESFLADPDANLESHFTSYKFIHVFGFEVSL